MWSGPYGAMQLDRIFMVYISEMSKEDTLINLNISQSQFSTIFIVFYLMYRQYFIIF